MRFIKTHAFFIFFLVVQAFFLIWLIGGASSADPANDAEAVGATIGAMLVIALWVMTDIILGIGYGTYKLATRKDK